MPKSVAKVLELLTQWHIHDIFHAALLSPYKDNDTHGPNHVPPPRDLVDGEEEQEVEAVIGHRGSASRQGLSDCILDRLLIFA